MKLKLALLICSSFFFTLAFAQTSDFEYSYCLKEVHFLGNENTRYIPIRKDDNSEFYTSPHFVQDCETETITTQNPVAYVSGKRAKVKAIFETNCTMPIYIRGVGPDIGEGENTEELIFFKDEPYTPINGMLETDDVNANERFVSRKVKYWENFTIRWQFSISGEENTWVDVDESVNTMYVTHKEPELTLIEQHIDPTVAFHTLLHIGCMNSNNENDPDLIVDNIYTEFMDQDVRRVDGAGPIKYWGPENTPNPACWQVSQMLVNLDGRCGGWAAFFEDVLRVQGITSSVVASVTWNNYLNMDDKSRLEDECEAFFGSEYINVQFLEYFEYDPILETFVPVAGSGRSIFFVKNWEVSETENFVMNEYDNIRNGIIPTETTLINGNVIRIKEEQGAAGQGNDDPRSEFGGHAIVKYSGKYYDPSYGSEIVDNKNAWEDQSLDGLGSYFIYRRNEGGVMHEYFVNWVAYENILDELQITIAP